MKQAIFSIAMFLMIASSKHSIAQSITDVALSVPGLITAFSAVELRSTEVSSNEVNAKAIRDFSKTYKNVPDVKWFNAETGQFASFSSNGTHTRVVYNATGRRAYTIISYIEAKLDHGVRDLVKSKYYDAAIIGVHQFEFDNRTVYAIKILDHNSKPITLKVSDGKIEDITTYDKK